MIAAVLLVVAAVAGYQYWQARKEARLGEAGEVYQALLLRTEDLTGRARAETFRAAEGLSGNYRDLARLEAASAFVEAGAAAEALPLFQAVAAEAQSELLQHFAALSALRLDADQLSPDERLVRLDPLIAQGAPLRPAALEMMALIHLELDDPDTVREYLSQVLADPDVPVSLRRRAQDLRDSLPEPARPPAQTEPEAAPEPEVAPEPATEGQGDGA